MTVRPREGMKVPSRILCGWERGLVYSVMEAGEMNIQEAVIKGIVGGCEFVTLEFSDCIEEVPYGE